MRANRATEEAPIGYPNKIVTCCYCGTRAALVLRGKERHELSCSACGAPLHNLKMLRTDKRDRYDDRHDGRGFAGPDRSRRAAAVHAPRPKRRKKRKGLMKKVFEEVFDVIEDVFD